MEHQEAKAKRALKLKTQRRRNNMAKTLYEDKTYRERAVKIKKHKKDKHKKRIYDEMENDIDQTFKRIY
tara:strand:+ start:3236 stop:3442 length:207 start_codon:yes stop_codon:yes gene_type:complete